MARVSAHHPSRGPGRRPRQPRCIEHLSNLPISRGIVVHLAWCGAVLLAVGSLVGAELASPCPSGGPLAFGDCVRVRPFVIGVLTLAAGLYLVGLTAVVGWTSGLRRRGVADARAARDWYVLVAGVGLLVAPLLAFTLVSAIR